MLYKRALLVVDVQNDFCPGGTLPVPEADTIIPVLNRYIGLFSKEGLPVFFSRDWHPKKTAHFKKYGGLWPVHCVQGTCGARFHPRLKIPKRKIILSKGMNPLRNSYSAFQAEDEAGLSFLSILKIFGVTQLYVGGLATDYCVKSSVLDALKKGFKVKLLHNAIKGVDMKPGDSARAIKAMVKRGARAC